MRVRSPDSLLWTALHLCGLRRIGVLLTIQRRFQCSTASYKN